MRLSTQQLFQSGVSAMQRAQVDLNHTSMQMSTGRRILTPSDDPGGATQVMHFDAAIKNTDQFQRNIDFTRSKLQQEEGHLGTVENLLQQARELVVKGSNDTYDSEDRDIIATEIREIRDHLYAIGNSRDSNGEYLFSGTTSDNQPLVISDDGRVSYVGSQGQGALRELEVSATHRVAIGDTGAAIFMEVPEKSSLVAKAVVSTDNTTEYPGDLHIKSADVAYTDFALSQAGETFTVEFEYPKASGKVTDGDVTYRVIDVDGNVINDEEGNPIEGTYGSVKTAPPDAMGLPADAPDPYVYYEEPDPRQSIEFAGRTLELTGTPGDGDQIISEPVKELSVFDTLDRIAEAFENDGTPLADTVAGRTKTEGVNIVSAQVLNTLDARIDTVTTVRASIGIRLQTLDSQNNLNEEQLLNLKTARSEIQDLDYAEAISRFTLQQTALQAAQQTYTQVNRLSLFNFL